jgi:hypothetical protein
VTAVFKSGLVEKVEMETKRTKWGNKLKKENFSGLFAFSPFVLFVSTLIPLKEADFSAVFRSVCGLIERG